MKKVFFLMLIFFSTSVFAEVNSTFHQHAKINNLLAETPSIAEKVDEMEASGFKYYGFLKTGITAFCDCQVLDLTFVKYEDPKDSSQVMRTKVVQSVRLYIQGLQSEAPTVSFE